jgi:hypothetical protein
MKIAVEGKIIDTEKIYSVSDEILDQHNEYYFVITSFNGHEIEVGIKMLAPNKVSNEYEKLCEFCNSNLSDEQWKKIKELHVQIHEENKNKLERMRLDIVKIWSENQSLIPKFKVENY